MARAIDKQTMLDLIVEAKRTDPETGGFAEWLAEYLAEHLPTLTPPNEPLTLEELREMEQSTPVWWDYIPCWVLVRRGSVLVFGSEPHKVENLFGYFYRRPPEGEEDT